MVESPPVKERSGGTAPQWRARRKETQKALHCFSLWKRYYRIVSWNTDTFLVFFGMIRFDAAEKAAAAAEDSSFGTNWKNKHKKIKNNERKIQLPPREDRVVEVYTGSIVSMQSRRASPPIAVCHGRETRQQQTSTRNRERNKIISKSKQSTDGRLLSEQQSGSPPPPPIPRGGRRRSARRIPPPQ